MRSRLALGLTVLAVFGGASMVVRAAAVDTAASVQQAARRLEIPNNTPYPIGERPGRDMLAIINLARLQRGLPIYFWNDQVAAAATGHSVDMAARGRLDYLSGDGVDAGVRLQRAGVAWTTWGENIGAGFDDPQVLFNAWVNSPSHQAHLFGGYTYIGIGVAATPDGVAYWTLDVAS